MSTQTSRMSRSPARAPVPGPRRCAALAVALLAPLALVSLGFDLDRGELKCEQAAIALAECCPDLVFGRESCVQEGGCERDEEGTILTMEESDCLREDACEEIVARNVCERLRLRMGAARDPEGPGLGNLVEGDPLCE